MANINFVPDDYIQKKQSNRTNWIYLFLCIMMLGALGGTFSIIKVRQSALSKQAQKVAEKMTEAQKDIQRFEELQTKRKEMMQTALTAVELLEDTPRSIVIAALTNNLPSGTSILRTGLSEKKTRASATRQGGYAKAQSSQATKEVLNTEIEIEGIAPSDGEVADYIANLDKCALFKGINLIYTKEFKNGKNQDSSVRMFKISTELAEKVDLTKEFIDSLKINGV